MSDLMGHFDRMPNVRDTSPLRATHGLGPAVLPPFHNAKFALGG